LYSSQWREIKSILFNNVSKQQDRGKSTPSFSPYLVSSTSPLGLWPLGEGKGSGPGGSCGVGLENFSLDGQINSDLVVDLSKDSNPITSNSQESWCDFSCSSLSTSFGRDPYLLHP
jgi:hypothetical protein